MLSGSLIVGTSLYKFSSSSFVQDTHILKSSIGGGNGGSSGQGGGNSGHGGPGNNS